MGHAMATVILTSSVGCMSGRMDGYELRIYQFSVGSSLMYGFFEPAILLRDSGKDVCYRHVIDSSGPYERNVTLLESWAEKNGFLEDECAYMCVEPHSRMMFHYNKREMLNQYEHMIHTLDGYPAYRTVRRLSWPLADPSLCVYPNAGRRRRHGEFEYILLNDGSAAITRYLGPTTVVLDIPSTMNGAKVTRIWDGAFMGRWAFVEVAIPEGITHIGRRAFEACRILERVRLPASIVEIGDYAFYDTNLRNITIPNGVISIGESAFVQPGRLGTLIIRLGSSLEAVGVNSFYGCKVDGDSLDIPDSVRIIGDGAFRMTGVKTVTLGRSVESLHPLAFGSDIQEFRVHPDNAFYSALNGVLYDKKRLTLVRWPVAREVPPRDIRAEGIERIGSYAFSYCGLERMDIPQGVTSIESNAFFKALSLREVRIGPDVSHIGRHAFLGCERLETLRFYGDAPETDGDPFREIYTQRYPSRRAMRHVSPESRPRWPGRTEVVRIEPPKGLVVQRLEGASGWRRWIRPRWHGIPVQSFELDADGEDLIELSTEGNGE